MQGDLPGKTLVISALQLGLFSKEIDENLLRLKSGLLGLPDTVDLVVAAELANTYYNYEVIQQLKAGAEIAFLEPLQKVCEERKFALVVGMATRVGNDLVNRAYVIGKDGKILTHYDKTHLIEIMDEHKYFTAGKRLATFAINDWKVGVAICFDLRFAELFINYALSGCHLIVLPACWPSERRNHWRHLLLARAQECQCFFMGVNMGGRSNDGKLYGGSLLASPDSIVLEELEWGSEGSFTYGISSEDIRKQKELFDLMKDRPCPPLFS